MRERNILLYATVRILSGVSKGIRYHLYISCLEDEKHQINYGILLSVAMN